MLSLFHCMTIPIDISALMKRITIVLWFVMCCCYTIDTRLFVYLSLSQTLMGGLAVLLMSLTSLLYSFCSSCPIRLSRFQLWIILWMAYMAIHAYITQRVEVYKLLYLEETLLLLITLPNLISSHILSRRVIDNGILLMTGINLLCLFLQSVGGLDSYNQYFKLTGFSENPNVTSILLAVTVPVLIDRVKESSNKFGYVSFLILTIWFILLLKCRTAYIGLSVILFVRLTSSQHCKSYWRRKSKSSRMLISLLLVVFALSSALVLYCSKRASSDGRLLIWKVSAMMVLEQPMGSGIGMFEHDYNLRQGEYFASGESTEQERFNSSTVYMAYNDFLEHCVEAGVLGLMFIFSFYGYLIFIAYRRNERELLPIVVAFFVMSFVNFIYSSIQPWIVLMAYSSLVICSEEYKYSTADNNVCKTIITISCIMCLFFLCPHISLFYSQMRLKQLQTESKTSKSIHLSAAESLAEHIGTSEAYYGFMCLQYKQRGMYEDALQAILIAKRYTSSPDVFFSAFSCHARMGNPMYGIHYLNELRKMLPQNLTSRYILLQCYDQEQQYAEALSIAEEITGMNLKICNKQSNDIKLYAKEYLNRTQNEQNNNSYDIKITR